MKDGQQQSSVPFKFFFEMDTLVLLAGFNFFDIIAILAWTIWQTGLAVPSS